MKRTCLKCGAINPDARGFVTDACPACNAVYSKIEASRMFRPESAVPSAPQAPRGSAKHMPYQRSLWPLAGVGVAAILLGQLLAPESTLSSRRTDASASEEARLAQPAAAVEPQRTVTRRSIGCASRGDFDEIVSLSVSGDKAALEKALTVALLSGRCTSFEVGEAVYLEDVSLLSGVIQIRRAGELGKFWTAREATK